MSVLETVGPILFGVFGAALILISLMKRSKKTTRAAIPTEEAAKEQTAFLFDSVDLVDATPSANALLAVTTNEDSTDWSNLRGILLPRFAKFPLNPSDVPEGDAVRIVSDDLGVSSWVDIRRAAERVNVTLGSDLSPTHETEAERHRQRLVEIELTTLRQAVQGSPYPVWQVNALGSVIWANEGYKNLAGKLLFERGHVSEDIPRLFELPDFSNDPPEKIRLPLTGAGGEVLHWFDITTVRYGDLQMHYAMDVNAVVNAEIAQRNFVQTLTKTFAQLSIGLAIFDRKRQLALFNPALIDLTNLPADFLSARPTLMSFFDRMRENRMMPEPKNYSSWREQIADVVAAASDGRYLETWALQSGQTYRVNGRPHPDGAVAFLFEDISAEVSLTRRFRAELELSQTVLNHLDHAIVVFSSSGVLTFSNTTYCELFGIDPDSSFAEITVLDASRHWKDKCMPTEAWRAIRDFVVDFGDRETLDLEAQLLTGERLVCRIVPLTGAATMVQFHKVTEEITQKLLRLPV